MAILTVAQTALRTNLSEKQIVELIREKKFDARFVGRAWLIDEASLERYLDQVRSNRPDRG